MPEAVVSRLLGALPSTKSRTTRTTSPITGPGTGRPAQKASASPASSQASRMVKSRIIGANPPRVPLR